MQQWFPACPLFLPLSLSSLYCPLLPFLILCFMQSLINHMATATHRTTLRPIKCISSFHLSIYLPPAPLTRPLPSAHCTSVRLVRGCVLYVLQLAWQQRRRRWWRQCPTGFPIWSHISATCSHCVSINGGNNKNNNTNNYDILLMLLLLLCCPLILIACHTWQHRTAHTRTHILLAHTAFSTFSHFVSFPFAH